MRNNLVFGLMAAVTFVFVACDGSSGGGSTGGTASSSSSSGSNASSSGMAGAGGMGGSENNGGTAGMGGVIVGGAAGMGGSGGGLPKDALCGQSAGGAMCGNGLACCYPCGIPGCDWKCMTPCDPNTPGCINGCMLVP